MDICNIREIDCLSSSIDQDLTRKCLPEHAQYACRYWIRHLEGSDIHHHHEKVLCFLKEHFFHWLEALSLMGQISEAVLMITALLSVPFVRQPIMLYNLEILT